MAYVDDLKTTRDQVLARITAVTASPKPSYNADGQMVSWTEYLRELRAQLKELNAMIREAEGPFEFRTRAFT